MKIRRNNICLSILSGLAATAAWAAVDRITVIPPGQTAITVTEPAPAKIEASSTTAPAATINTSGYGNTTVTLPMIQETGPTGYDGRPGATGYDGRPGAPALSCEITGGTRSITYDQVGLNPQPAMTPFGVIVRVGGQVVEALRQQWQATIGEFIEIVTTPSITPTVGTSFTTGDHHVTVFADYSAGSLAGGKRSCTVSIPIAVTRIGETGAQGPPGSNAEVTEQSVIQAFAEGASDNPLVLQSATADQVKIDVRDELANSRWWVDSSGRWGGGDGAITGDLTLSRQLLTVSAVPSLVTAASVIGTYAVTPATATAYYLTLTGATTFTFGAPIRAQESLTLVLKQGGTGSKTATWPTSVSWGAISAPTLSTTAGKQDIVSCITADGGTKWMCQYALGY